MTAERGATAKENIHIRKLFQTALIAAAFVLVMGAGAVSAHGESVQESVEVMNAEKAEMNAVKTDEDADEEIIDDPVVVIPPVVIDEIPDSNEGATEIPAEITAKTPANKTAVEKLILNGNTDKDIAGSTYAPLKDQSKMQTSKAISLKWSAAPGASQYAVYGAPCGSKNKMKKLATVRGKKFTVKKIDGKKLKKGCCYKFIVVAENGDDAVAVSKTIHVSAAGKKSAVNYTKVNVSKKVAVKAKKLKKGNSVALKAKAVTKKGIKAKTHVKVRYESSNKAVATVSKAGKVKARTKGKCIIYAYAQNGVCKQVKLTVK